jgi:hypothetical protein
MKHWLTVLALLAGLGSLISCKQSVSSAAKPINEQVKKSSAPVQNYIPDAPVRIAIPSIKPDPYDRYLEDQKTDASGPALTRFASNCGVDVLHHKSKRAINVGDKWFQEEDLSKPSDDPEEATDFFLTYQVWSDGHRVLVESWNIIGSDGKETRDLYCFEDRLLREIEDIAWSFPPFEDENGPSAWGYKQRWQRDTTGKMQRVTVEFVDGMERPIPKPKLDADDEKSLEWPLALNSLDDLKLPSVLLR